VSSVVVVGGGPWARLAAWRLARAGRDVALIAGPQTPAGAVAAGMLGPRSEADERDPALYPLLAAAFAGWPLLADEVAADSGTDPGLRICGCLHVAARREHIAAIRHHAAALAALGTPAEWLPGSTLRELEPGLGGVAGGLLLPEEGEIDPRRLMAALVRAGTRSGVRTVDAVGVEVIRGDGGRAAAVRDGQGRVHRGDTVVVAVGHPAPPPAGLVPIRPVKGQILRLRVPPDADVPLIRTVRTPEVYVVPRRAEEIAVGATVEEASDRRVTAGAALDLLEAAVAVCPELRELELHEASAAPRPATPDGRPAIGRDPHDGVFWAAGGHRHGILLAPLVAQGIDADLRGAPIPAALGGLAPGRFAAVRA